MDRHARCRVPPAPRRDDPTAPRQRLRDRRPGRAATGSRRDHALRRAGDARLGTQVAERGGLEGAQALIVTEPKRVVVLGGGFAGVSTAQTLVKRLRRARRTDVEVVLLNRDNYFVFQPLLADILSATIETTHAVVPLRRMMPGVHVEG